MSDGTYGVLNEFCIATIDIMYIMYAVQVDLINFFTRYYAVSEGSMS